MGYGYIPHRNKKRTPKSRSRADTIGQKRKHWESPAYKKTPLGRVLPLGLSSFLANQSFWAKNQHDGDHAT